MPIQRDNQSYTGDLVTGMRVRLSHTSDGEHFEGPVYSVCPDGNSATIKRDDGQGGSGAPIHEPPYNGRGGWLTCRTHRGAEWSDYVVGAWWPVSRKWNVLKVVTLGARAPEHKPAVDLVRYYTLRRKLRAAGIAGECSALRGKTAILPKPKGLATGDGLRISLRAHPEISAVFPVGGSVWEKLSCVRRAAETLAHELRARQNRDTRRLAAAEGVSLATLQKRLDERRREILLAMKRPKTDARHIGIEIEFISELSDSGIRDKLLAARLHKWVHLTGDGSVEDDNGDNGHELRVLVTEEEAAVVLPKVTACLSDDCDAEINRTCGLHVHLDMRGRAREEVAKIYANLVRAHFVLKNMLPPSRRANTYCRENESADFIETADRYRMVNARAYSAHETLEVRSHAGTLDATKILRWVKILLAARDAEFRLRAPSTAAQLATWLKLSKELEDYITTRQALFATRGTESDAHV